ncbi:unnamed protein product [Microthlaspi erraticum]|uniref:Uncharacterized protein n=1 Tax=Microthlaspi erraticum TaxID=1685480 RepID=A0A6D2IVZ8_9BRAS|nr:unnamed protein product [Microthlaspi erraticum]
MSRLPPSMWCDRPIGYNSSYPLSCWCFCLIGQLLIQSVSHLYTCFSSTPEAYTSLSVAGCLSLIALGILGAYPRPLSSLAAGVVAQLIILIFPSSWCHHLVGLEQDCSKCTFPRPEGFVRFPVWRVSSPSCLRIKISYFNPSLISMFLSFHIVAWKCAEYLHPEHLRFLQSLRDRSWASVPSLNLLVRFAFCFDQTS